MKVHNGAPTACSWPTSRKTQRTASRSGSARSAELELTTRLDYEIRGEKNLLLLQDKLELQSIYVHDENNLIGSSQSPASCARKCAAS